jgi:hypothetical protein
VKSRIHAEEYLTFEHREEECYLEEGEDGDDMVYQEGLGEEDCCSAGL